MQVARDSSPFGLGFISQLQTSAGQIAVRCGQLRTGAMNPPVLQVAPAQSNQRQQQKDRQRRRGPGKRRAGHREFERQRICRGQVFRKRTRHDFVFARLEFLHREL